ncbi:MAG: SPFH domain-containing protein [Defluviitaleaceae bacterium]|nr:SPFH domain-containing protein [Defluviitaleaceae bacterium]
MEIFDNINSGAIFIVVIILVAVFLALFILMSLWKRVPQDKAMVVTGLRKRVISGGGGLVMPIFERTDKISLENMKIDVRTGGDGAMTAQGVSITADGVAIIKIKSDKESILAAVEQFNAGSEARTISVIEGIAKDVLEGKLREIISKLTVEDIYRDREKFASEVQGNAAQDLAEMGLEIKTFTIRDISDNNGYLAALGKKRISEVKRDAQIAEAEAAKETKIRTAEASRLGEEARLRAETQVAEVVKEKELKVQAFRKEQETSKAVADLAYEIESNKVKKEVTETNMQVEIIRKQKEIELAEQEALRKEKELQATIVKQADAEKYRLEKEAEVAKYREIQNAQGRAESIRMEGASLAESKRLQGMAEVDIIRERGHAEADAMMKKAEAFKQYNDAAVTQMIIERLPEIAKNVAEPLSKTEKIVVIDNGNGAGGGASKVAGYVTDIISTLPTTVEALTGIDIVSKLKSVTAPPEEDK